MPGALVAGACSAGRVGFIFSLAELSLVVGSEFERMLTRRRKKTGRWNCGSAIGREIDVSAGGLAEIQADEVKEIRARS